MEQLAAVDEDWDLVARLAADLHDAHARLVTHTAQVIADGSWEGRGLRSPEHWLVLRAGLSQGQARAIVLLARRRSELPETTRALNEGRISLDQAAVVARHTPTEFDATVAEFAQHATVPQLQRSVAKYDFSLEESAAVTADPTTDSSSPKEPIAPPTLTMHHEDDRFVLRYDAPSSVGALVEAALAEAKDALFQQASQSSGNAPDTDPTRVSWADALELMASRSLDAVEVTGRRSKYRVNVFLDTDGGWLTGRARLPQHVVDGLTCDGELVPVWTTEGRPVNVGRSRRVVPERARRLIIDRDRGCRFPGCTASSFVEIHHLVHWRDGGATDVDNLVSLCPFHHDAHHRREFTLSGDPTRDDGLRFVTALGVLIRPGPTALRGDPPSHSSPRLSLVPREPGAEPSAAAGALGEVRPKPRLGRTYPAPAGDTLYPGLVDFTPYPALTPLN